MVSIVESIDVVFNDSLEEDAVVDDDNTATTKNTETQVVTPVKEQSNEDQHSETSSETKSGTKRDSRVTKNHSLADVIGNLKDGMQKQKKEIDFKNLISHIAKVYFVSMIEPKNVSEAFKDEHWIAAMQDELLEFQRCNVWYLTTLPK